MNLTYLELNGMVLLVLAVGAVYFPRNYWAKVVPVMLALLALTAIFDNLIIIAGIEAYDPARILGLKIFSAPIEDFAYTVAAVCVLPAVWEYFKKS